MKDRVAGGTPLHYLAALGPPSRAAWERAAASISAAAAKRARLSVSTEDDADTAQNRLATLKLSADDKWNLDIEPNRTDNDRDGGRTDYSGSLVPSVARSMQNSQAVLRSRSPARTGPAAPPLRPAPFVAASVATEAAVQATCALSRPVEVLARAGRLLAKPQLPTTFADEEDMRRVLALVYDVFRYKAVLSEVLSETGFFNDFIKLREQEQRVWLLLLDLIGRRFTGRTATPSGGALLAAAGLADADSALWSRRVPLAAAVARARVRCGALRMSQLLPPRLRDENMQRAASRPISAWLNPFILHGAEPAAVLLEEAGLLLKGSPGPAGPAGPAPNAASSASTTAITVLPSLHPSLTIRPWSRGRASDGRSAPPTCMRDCACPLFVVCCGGGSCSGCSGGTGLAGRTAVRRGALVLLERARCCGAAALAGSINSLQLTGAVAQTHIVCARSTAYLAALFADNPRVGPIIAFGAGERKDELEVQLRNLGVTQEHVVVRSEAWLRANVELLENVCAVMASPPGAMAAVQDPVGLACARACDVALLEAVADAARATAPPATHGDARPAFVEEPPVTRDEAQQRRAKGALAVDEQRAVLRMAMAMPQIQVVVFQTYTLDTGESKDLVTRLVAEANTVARQKRAELAYLMGLRTTSTAFSSPDAESSSSIQTQPPTVADASPGDLFEVAPLGDDLVPPPDEGCFVTLLRRKEVSLLPTGRSSGITEEGSEAEASESGPWAGKRRRARTRARGRTRTVPATTEGEVASSKAGRMGGLMTGKLGKSPIARRSRGARLGPRVRHRESTSTGTGTGASEGKRPLDQHKTEGFRGSTIVPRQRGLRRPAARSGQTVQIPLRPDNSIGYARRRSRAREEEAEARRLTTRARRESTGSRMVDGSRTTGRSAMQRETSQARVRRPLRRVLRLPIASIPLLPHAPLRRLPVRIPHRLLLLVV